MINKFNKHNIHVWNLYLNTFAYTALFELDAITKKQGGKSEHVYPYLLDLKGTNI